MIDARAKLYERERFSFVKLSSMRETIPKLISCDEGLFRLLDAGARRKLLCVSARRGGRDLGTRK